jgi:2-dehydropantoate 2-reductase
MARRERFAIAIVGTGALGTLFADRLSRVVPTARIGRDTRNFPEADWVIVLVKAYDTDSALRSARAMKPRAVVSLQNGLIERVPQGVTTAAAYREGTRVVPVATGTTLLPPGFAVLAAHLRDAGFDARVTRQIDVARRRKLLANVCINPLTAVFRIRNGEVRDAPHRPFVEALAHEAAAVLALPKAAALNRVLNVAKVTAGNRSSMLQDVLAGRRTENEYLTGALLRLARRKRIAAPTHEAFFQLVRVMERAIESR